MSMLTQAIEQELSILAIIFAETLLAALRFTALWAIFYLLHRPKTKVRLILAIIIMILQYPLCRILFLSSGGILMVRIACDTLLFFTLGFLYKDENGDLFRPLISAFYFNGMLQLNNYIMRSYMFAFYGAIPAYYSFWSYFWKTIEGIIIVLWAVFYYRMARNMTAKSPLSFSLLTVLTPLAGLAIIAASSGSARYILEYGVNVFLFAGLFGTLIVILNMVVFYLYTKLSVAHEALVFAGELAKTPPVWTVEQGLSAAFLEKYEITPREKEVIEAMLHGKTDKEISVKLNLAVNTVQVHLKRIYRKTGTAGRFALSSLIRGG
ncbi:MAG: helix-turn-helix transcriptional regulator [Treponema sp.]|nr:helix-turn-helix transcriptional regulator [Treponema sp.]